jgi:hypothetical protein
MADVAVAGVNHKDYPPAALTKLKALGDSCFIEYAWAATHIFTPDKAPNGTILSKRFLEIDATNDNAYLLTDYTMRVLPTGVAWAQANPGLTNYIKLCDENYYWERSGASFPHNRVRFRQDATAVSTNITVHATASGYFIPVSGLGASGGGTGANSVFTPAGATGIAWKAKLTPDNYKTVVDPIAENRPAGVDGANVRTLTISESNQNPAVCTVTFNKPAVGNISTTVSATDKTAVEAWLTALFTDANLRAHNNKISVTITGEAGNARRDARVAAVKAIVQAKLDALKASNSIKVHPGLDNSGNPREGVLGMNAIDMTTSTRKIMVVKLPNANPDDPGSFVGPESASKCPIALDMYIEAHSRALGLCEGADVLACFKSSQGAVDVCVTMHELGHSYGQAVFTASDQPPKGMTKPKNITQAETVNRYKNNGNNGHPYDRHNHSGSHCAFGLSDAQKGQASFQQAALHAAAACVMWGAGGQDRNFCPQCIDLIRGANMTAIPVVAGS